MARSIHRLTDKDRTRRASGVSYRRFDEMGLSKNWHGAKSFRADPASCQNEKRVVAGVNNVIRLSWPRVAVGSPLEESFAMTQSPLDSDAGYAPTLQTGLDRVGRNAQAPNREESMLDQLDQRDRLRLVEFVCSFAWADFEVQPAERVFISRLISRLELDESENLQVQNWLDRPRSMDDLDPTSIPAAHRRVFVEAIEGLISADGEISDEERDSFEIFKQLLVD